MKEVVKVVSDLHLEFFGNFHKVERLFDRLFAFEIKNQVIVDKLFIAGDLCSCHPKYQELLITWFECVFKSEIFRKVYWVWGNHEWYGLDWEDNQRVEVVKFLINSLAADYKNPKPIIIAKEPTLVGEVFLSPLWYPDTPDSWLLQDNLSDFKWIKNCNPSSFHDIYERTAGFLEVFTTENRPDYWVFHHLPTFQSVSEHFRTDRLNCYYVGDIERYILSLSPRMVVHGHSHTPVDYWLGNTLIKSNPIGYP